MWTSQTMTFYESFVTFLIGFTVVFSCLIALALFIMIASKIVGMIAGAVPQEKPQQVAPKAAAPVAAPKVVKDNQEELENLAIIISAISEEMKEPVENFSILIESDLISSILFLILLQEIRLKLVAAITITAIFLKFINFHF